MTVPRIALFATLATVFLPAVATAGVEDWEVNEVVTSVGGSPTVQYIELVNQPGGCLFPSSRVEVFGGDGTFIGGIALATVTTCWGAATIVLIATGDAETEFGVTADKALPVAVPAGSGQVCFTSSSTRYDCVRWGAPSSPIVDFFGPGDTTTAPAPPDGISLARIATTHVVEDDWQLATPTPRAFNDGTPYVPPDAGPAPDAAIIVDAGPPIDAAPRPDAISFDAASDARNTSFLDLDPVGGAGCDCRVGSRGIARELPGALLIALLAALRRRRSVGR